MKNTKKLAILGMMIALHIILNSVATIPTPMNRFGPSFLVMALSGGLFGPGGGAVVGGLSDFIRANAMPQGGNYFPGFTITSIIAGLIYGFFLYNKEPKAWRIACASLLVDLVPNFLINSYWLSMLRGITYTQSLYMRLVPAVFQAQLKLIIMLIVYPKLYELTKKKLLKDGYR